MSDRLTLNKLSLNELMALRKALAPACPPVTLKSAADFSPELRDGQIFAAGRASVLQDVENAIAAKGRELSKRV